MKNQKNHRPLWTPLAAIALGTAGLLVYQANQQPNPNPNPNAATPPIKSRVSHRESTTRTPDLSSLQIPLPDAAIPTIPEETPAMAATPRVFQEFNDWAVTYSNATPARQQEMLAAGETMVAQRRERMAALIEKSPQAALDEADAFSPLAREALPESLKAQLEQPVNARGDLSVMAYIGKNTAPYEWTTTFGDEKYTVFPAADNESIIFEPNRSLLGIKLTVNRVMTADDGKTYSRVDKLMALRKQRVRALSNEEATVALKTRKKGADPTCEVSTKSVAVAVLPAAIETGGDTKWMCEPDHATAWLKSPAGIAAAANRQTYSAAGGPGEGAGSFTWIPEGKSTGDQPKPSLCAIFHCSDQPATYRHTGYQSTIDSSFRQLEKWSYGKIKFATPTYTPLFKLPHTADEYKKKTYSIRDDTTAKLKSEGYNLANYAFHMVLVADAMSDRDGGADIAGTFIEIGNPTNFVFQHEIGHIIGLPHSRLWIASTSDSVGPGFTKDYYGAYSTMGLWENRASFNTMERFYIRWLTLNDAHILARGDNSTYTIYDPEVNTLTSGRKYTIRIPRSDGSFYFVEFRPRFNAYVNDPLAIHPTTQNGIRILRTSGAEQIDCTPATSYNGIDGALPAGQEFYDAAENITIKAVGRGGDGENQFFNVQVLYNRPTVTPGRTYMLRAKEGNLIAGVANSSGENAALVTQQSWQGYGNQQWVPIKVDFGHYKIVNMNSGKVLDVTGGSTASGRLIQQWAYLGGSSQKWRIIATEDGYFKVINVHSGLALSSPYPRTQAGIQLEQYPYNGWANQKWSFDEVNPLVSGRTYQVTARHSFKVLEVPGINAPNGTLARQWSWFGSMNQRWIPVWLGNGQHSISNASSNKVLEVGGLSSNDGGTLQQWSWVGHNWQKWTLEAVDNDAGGFWYKIVNVGSGRVASVNGMSLSDGAGLQQWGWRGYTNQQWRFYRLN